MLKERAKCIVLYVPVELGRGLLWTVCAESVHQMLIFIPPCFPIKLVPLAEGCHSKIILSGVFSLMREMDDVCFHYE